MRETYRLPDGTVTVTREVYSAGYADSDRFAGRCAECAIESGENPLTIEEVCRALHAPMPVTDADLRSLAFVCYQWGIRTNMDGEPAWECYLVGESR
jgi:hypothetical protein